MTLHDLLTSAAGAQAATETIVEAICDQEQDLDLLWDRALTEDARITVNQTPRSRTECLRRLHGARSTRLRHLLDIHTVTVDGHWVGVNLVVTSSWGRWGVSSVELGVLARRAQDGRIDTAHVAYRVGHGLQRESRPTGSRWKAPRAVPDGQIVQVRDLVHRSAGQGQNEAGSAEDDYERIFTPGAVQRLNARTLNRRSGVRHLMRHRSRAEDGSTDLLVIADDGPTFATRYLMSPSRPGPDLVVTEFGQRTRDGRLASLSSLIQNTNGTWAR